MKVQLEGDLVVGNHGLVIIRGWTIKADDGEAHQDVVVGMKRLAIERLVLALDTLRDDIRKIEGGSPDPSALMNIITNTNTKH